MLNYTLTKQHYMSEEQVEEFLEDNNLIHNAKNRLLLNDNFRYFKTLHYIHDLSYQIPLYNCSDGARYHPVQPPRALTTCFPNLDQACILLTQQVEACFALRHTTYPNHPPLPLYETQPHSPNFTFLNTDYSLKKPYIEQHGVILLDSLWLNVNNILYPLSIQYDMKRIFGLAMPSTDFIINKCLNFQEDFSNYPTLEIKS